MVGAAAMGHRITGGIVQGAADGHGPAVTRWAPPRGFAAGSGCSPSASQEPPLGGQGLGSLQQKFCNGQL